MKIVINKCYGGFSLSPKAVSRLAELNGKKCYWFRAYHKTDKYTLITEEQACKEFCPHAFDVSDIPPNPSHDFYEQHSLDNRPPDRSDPKLVQVVQELGKEANGNNAKLAIVEIPDGTNYEIKEYDGMEHVAEVHRTWN